MSEGTCPGLRPFLQHSSCSPWPWAQLCPPCIFKKHRSGHSSHFHDHTRGAGASSPDCNKASWGCPLGCQEDQRSSITCLIVWCRSDLLPHQAGVSVTSYLCGVGSLSNKPRESHTASCRGGARRSLTPGKEGGEEKQSVIRTEEGQLSALVPTVNQQFKTRGEELRFLPSAK